MVRETHCAGVAIGRGCQGRPWLFSDIKHAFAGDDTRLDPDLGQVSQIIMRHARLLVEFFDGDERMAVHDMRKHIAWYLKGFPVGGSTRKAFMECEGLDDMQRELNRLDPELRLPERLHDAPRGRVRYAKKFICLTDGSIRVPRRTNSVRRCSAMTRWMPGTDRVGTGP